MKNDHGPGNDHEPGTAFVENLEWQLKTAVRRRERFAEPVSRRLHSLALMTGLALLSLTVGAAGAVAAGKLQDGEKAELLLKQNRIQLELAERRVQAASSSLDLAQQRYETGIVAQDEIQEVQQRLLAERFLLQRLELERQEMQLSGERAALAFSAPLIAGRDFITEHLALEASYERGRLQILDEQWQLALRRAEAGVVGLSEADELRGRVEEGRRRIEALEEEILLRGLFLRGELTPEEAELRKLRLELNVRQRVLRARHERVQGETLRTRTLFEQGLVSETNLRELQLELDGLEADLVLLEIEARILDAELGVELPEVREETAPEEYDPVGKRIDETGGDVQKLHELARSFKAEGNEQAARQVYQRIVEIDSENGEARRALRHHNYDGRWFESYAELSEYRREDDR